MEKEPLENSKVEFFIGILIGISPQVFPTMIWELRVFSILIFGGIMIHLINRSPWTIKLSWSIKLLTISFILSLIVVANCLLYMNNGPKIIQ